MDSYDLVIRGGTVIDGRGAPPFVADIAIKDGRILKIGAIAETAAEEIDAAGKIVTPGFVDVHTHYDGQAIWAERLMPSSIHGVTTVVLGNCGVGFAPCRAQDHDRLISVMEGVEDIPELVMTAGLPWTWETFPEYLDALDQRRHDIDVAAYLPHSPLRIYVMGERGANREIATAEDLRQMQRLMREALDAGALGFATSRLGAHRTGAGTHIPTFDADRRELAAMGEVMQEYGRGVLQVVPDTTSAMHAGELDLIKEFAAKFGRPVTFSLAQTNGDPEAWRGVLKEVHEANLQGGAITAQVFPRPVGLILGLDTSLNPFGLCPTYANQLASLPMKERVARMREPEMRARLLAETPDNPMNPVYLMSRDFAHIYPLNSVADYEPKRGTSFEEQAALKHVDPLELAYDMLLEKDGYALFYSALANYAYETLDPIRDMLLDANTIVGLGDGGAHYGVICDASYPTFVLSHWTRDRPGLKIDLATAVKALSHDPAQAIGLHDRGVIGAGFKADFNVIDYDRLQLHIPHMIGDLPNGGRRLMQGAEGYVATIVSGSVIQRDGQPTGVMPGRLVRVGAAPPDRMH